MTDRTKTILTEGLYAGLIGYAVVAVVLALYNIIVGRSPFYTVAMLGEALFYGMRQPAAMQEVRVEAVLAFNGLHLFVFIAVGVFAAWLASAAERGLQFWYLALSFFVFLIIHLIGAALWLPDAVVAGLPRWPSTLALLLAAAAMGAYLVRAHPRIRAELRHEYRDEEHAPPPEDQRGGRPAA